MSAPAPPRVLAAVMTYNRRDMLRRCLQGITAQTVAPDHVLVIDNASTDGTAAMLAEEFPGVQVYRTPENLGCTGAMHEALRLALERNPDYVWFFDDDAIPYPECLMILLREMRDLEREERIGFLRPMVRDPKTGDVGGAGLTMGSLLPAEVVSRIGLPRTELFIELSDHEYNARMRRAGYQILRVPLTLVEHPIDRPKRLPEIVADGYRVKPWRQYYAVRNRIYFSVYVERSIRGLLRALGMAVRITTLMTVFGRPRRGQGFVLRGILDGFTRRLGRRVEPTY